MGKQSTPSDYFKGAIYEVNEKFKNRFKKHFLGYNFKKFEGLKPKEDVIKEIYKFQGVWDQNFEIDGKIEFDADKGPFACVLESE